MSEKTTQTPEKVSLPQETISSPAGTGVISIITILLVLILAIFSILTLAAALADLSLAQRGAATVSEYYNADGIAKSLLEEFRQDGTKGDYEAIVPMNDIQGIAVHFLRQTDGSVAILSWKMVLIKDFSEEPESTLPVWTGE